MMGEREELLPFQKRVQNWLMACFSMEICRDIIERNHRFLEEALELVQSCGCTASEAHQLVDYVYGRPVGEPSQEVGGVTVTLAALCSAAGLDMEACSEIELARVWTKIDKIRAKHAAKPKYSPLPEYALRAPEAADAGAVLDKVREIVSLYFAPWGAAKGARWEALTGDQPFNPEIAMSLIEDALAPTSTDGNTATSEVAK